MSTMHRRALSMALIAAGALGASAVSTGLATASAAPQPAVSAAVSQQFEAMTDNGGEALGMALSAAEEAGYTLAECPERSIRADGGGWFTAFVACTK